ncbi:hypothetical protein JD844_027534, partial [Phrynosoma platyrhinos]
SETTARSSSSIPHTLLQYQGSSDSKGIVTAKPSEKVLYSRFAHSASAVNLPSIKSSSRMVRFPISSLLTLDKSEALTQFSSVFLFFSAIGNLKIVEVHSGGHYVKILNTSQDKEEGIGDHTLQQNLNGHPVAVYKFPPKIRMKANSSIRVWAVCSKMTHRPPTDYLWKDMDKFKPGPECTTILCSPTGQAVAWYTPINWNRKQTKEDEEGGCFSRNLIQPIIGVHQQQDRWETRAFDTWQGSVSQNNTKENEPEFILRYTS